MRIVFMGSAGFSCPTLKALVQSGRHEVVAVVTQPDRPKGRGRKVEPSPVRGCSPGRMKMLLPENVNDPSSLEQLRALKPDLTVVVAYGQKLGRDLLTIAPMGCINVHPSLLPKYRGAAPIPWAIANGDQVTGVTIMYVNEVMDSGDIILQKEVPIASDDTGGSLGERLAAIGADLLLEALDAIARGVVRRKVQSASGVTRAPKLKKQDGRLDWKADASAVCNRIRAFNPWPCCFCEAPAGSGQFLRVTRARVERATGGMPGDIVSRDGDGPLVRAGNGGVRLLEVQAEGGRPMSGAAYMRGHAGLTKLG